jgi:hypothetical protein
VHTRRGRGRYPFRPPPLSPRCLLTPPSAVAALPTLQSRARPSPRLSLPHSPPPPHPTTANPFSPPPI